MACADAVLVSRDRHPGQSQTVVTDDAKQIYNRTCLDVLGVSSFWSATVQEF